MVLTGRVISSETRYNRIMNNIKQFKVTDVKWHRNGVAGRSFYSVRFSYTEDDRFMPNMLAIVPGDAKVEGADTECFVLDMNSLTECFRGDNFVKLVWDAINKDPDTRTRK